VETIPKHYPSKILAGEQGSILPSLKDTPATVGIFQCQTGFTVQVQGTLQYGNLYHLSEKEFSENTAHTTQAPGVWLIQPS